MGIPYTGHLSMTCDVRKGASRGATPGYSVDDQIVGTNDPRHNNRKCQPVTLSHLGN